MKDHDKDKCDHRHAQTHVHEFLGSVKLAEDDCVDRHNHRFAGVTSEAVPLYDDNHKHAFMVNTDFFDHHHEVSGETGPAIPVGNGKHIHFAVGISTKDASHFHGYKFSTLIDSPLLPKCRK